MMWSARAKSLTWKIAAILKLGSIIVSVPKKLVLLAEEVNKSVLAVSKCCSWGWGGGDFYYNNYN